MQKRGEIILSEGQVLRHTITSGPVDVILQHDSSLIGCQLLEGVTIHPASGVHIVMRLDKISGEFGPITSQAI
jgi:hypothetical protein